MEKKMRIKTHREFEQNKKKLNKKFNVKIFSTRVCIICGIRDIKKLLFKSKSIEGRLKNKIK